ncbi:unnamed protein product [Mytilus edulis]|uniref:Uncharacterized protein n=1 Tax=Mytilus edulis TaxID=6550 RepID=A0A8S3RNJ4_MYTED|nr:unnamed protein product [Mytilus edulis]
MLRMEAKFIIAYTHQVTTKTSKALYRYLCQKIVGTDKHVKTMRQMNTVRDNLLSKVELNEITSGSYGEGLDLRGSDLDIMHVLKSIEVYEDEKPCFHPNITYFSMETDDVKPGFTLLQLEYSGSEFFSTDCEELNGRYYLSSTLNKQSFFRSSSDMIHGPCISSGEGWIC